MARTRVIPQADFAYEAGIAPAGTVLAGMDEVGRGAIAGPVCVGVAIVHDRTRPVPAGLTDSKLLNAFEREAMAQQLRSWVDAWAVGTATAREIDQIGIVGALRLAGQRALAEVAGHVGGVGLVLLDGSHDWLTDKTREPGALDLFTEPDTAPQPAVVTKVKADITCASVAAASVLAKCHRDALTAELDAHFPGYGWRSNKGYGSADHKAAISELGVTGFHRTSWRLT